MRVLLLSGGYGTRLRPLTNTIPKCLVPINGKPLLELWLERLNQAHMGPFLINTHYLADHVESFIRNSLFMRQVTIVHEDKLLGTAGTLIRNLDFFQGEEGMLIHADNYCLADFGEFELFHRKRPPECVMTMMTFRTEDPTSCGIVEIDQRGVVMEFHEKVSNPPGNLANGAIYILSPEMLAEISRDLSSVKDFSMEILSHFRGRIFTYETLQPLIDVGTLPMYNLAIAIAKNNCLVKESK